MEELREQIKRKLRVLSESNIAYYDLFPLLVFIAKYFPSISGQKEKISMSVGWYDDDVLILVYTILPEDDDLDSPTPAKESRIYFEVPEEVDLQVGGQLGGLADYNGNACVIKYPVQFISAIKYQKGDVNGDGKVNAGDYVAILNYVRKKITLTEEQLQRADANGDGKINAGDYVTVLNIVRGKI